MNRQADLQLVYRNNARRAEGAGIFWWFVGALAIWVLVLGVLA